MEVRNPEYMAFVGGLFENDTVRTADAREIWKPSFRSVTRGSRSVRAVGPKR